MKRELTEYERLELRVGIVEDTVRDIRGDVRTLVEEWHKFVPAVADKVTKEVLIPGIVTGLMNSLRVPISAETQLKDPLDLRDFDTRNFKKKGEG